MLLWSDSPGIYLQLKRWFLIRLVAVEDDRARALESLREKALFYKTLSLMSRAMWAPGYSLPVVHH